MGMDKPHSKFQHVYAIVRFDPPFDEEEPSNNVYVVKVFSSRDDAKRDVERLNEINAAKRCTYHLYTTRFVPETPGR